MYGARRVTVGIFFLALTARVFLVLHSGGFLGDYGYDGPVYYTASDSLLHGRVPYSDFVLLHPPGIMLALVPFAQLGRLTTDQTGFVTANIVFLIIGALNAALVVAVGRRMGLSTKAAAVGGAFYALWSGSTSAEYLVRLEPLGNFLLLLGLLAFFTSRRSPDWRWPLLCGLALGAAAGVKIWWSLPLLIVLAWRASPDGQRASPDEWRASPDEWRASPDERRTSLPRWRRGLALKCAGAAASLAVIVGPFFALAPAKMVRMVVFDQMGRHDNQPAIIDRLRTLTSLDHISSHLQNAGLVVAVGVLGAMFVAACLATLSAGPGRLVAVLAMAQIGLLLIAPSFYWFYADFAAPASALTLAVAAQRLAIFVRQPRASRRVRRWIVGIASVACAAAVGAMIFAMLPVRAVPPARGVRLAALVFAARCVTSDSPMLLIRMNMLSRNLERHCQVWVDVSGTVLGPDAMTAGADHHSVPPTDNTRWQRDVTSYLLSGDATMVVRPETGLSAASWTKIREHGELASSGSIVIYRTRKISPLTPVTDLAALTHW